MPLITRGILIIIMAVCVIPIFPAGESVCLAGETFTLARLKYEGGGDWYSNPSSLPNLLEFLHDSTGLPVSEEVAEVTPGGEDLFNYPIVYMNGHGNVSFTAAEAANMRRYLTSGGFLIADDNYGMNESFSREMKKVFPDKELVLLPADHPVFSCAYNFPGGLPKVHEHDGEPAQAYAIFHEGRMVVFYSYQSDLGDGWEDPLVHNDPEPVRRAALQFGVNLITWVLTN